MPSNKKFAFDFVKIIEDPETYGTKLSIKKLADLLKKLNDAYYNTSEPLVDDKTYDILYDVLKTRDCNNKVLQEIGAIPKKNPVKLPFPMPSLTKIRPGEKKMTKWFETYKGPFVISDKLDGMSAQIYKDSNGEIKMYSRGDSIEGRNITHILEHIIGNNAAKTMLNNTSVRGELVISIHNFNIINQNENYKNARNLVVGIVNSDNPDKNILKYVSFVAYNIIYPEYNISYQLELLEKWKFNVVWNKLFEIKELIDANNVLTNLLEERIKSSDFDIDGIVITDNVKQYTNNNKNPDHAMAFKTNTILATKNATVTKIIWDPSMYGYLQPIIEIEPINLSGTTIKYVTGKNAKFVRDNKIGVGSILKIVRSGGVIPLIMEVIKNNHHPDMPDVPFVWTESGVNIIATNKDDNTKKMINTRKNLHFFRTIGVKFLGPGMIDALYSNNYKSVNDIIKVYTTSDDKNIAKIGVKNTSKIRIELKDALKKVTLQQLMTGSLKFGRGNGINKISDVIDKCPNILELDKNEIEIILKTIDGFSDISIKKFIAGVDSFNKFMRKIEQYFKFSKVNSNTEGILQNECIVMTRFRDEIVAEFIKNNGGKLCENVTTKTTLVLYDESKQKTNKLTKANKLNIKTMTKDQFIEKYGIV